MFPKNLKFGHQRGVIDILCTAKIEAIFWIEATFWIEAIFWSEAIFDEVSRGHPASIHNERRIISWSRLWKYFQRE